MDLLSQMRAGTDLKFPARLKNATINLRVLSISEMMSIYNEVSSRLVEMPATAQNRISENLILAKCILRTASTEKPGRPAEEAKLSEYLLDQLTDAEILYLYRQWVAHNDKVNPSLEEMPHEELMRLVEEVKKNHLELTELSISQLTSLVRYLLNKEESPQVN